MVGDCERQVNKISGLIKNLLDVTRIAQGAMTLNKQRTDLSELIRIALKEYSEEIIRAKCDLTLHLEGNIFSDCDPGRIEQVFTNLLVSALKYANGNSIHISSLTQNENAVIRVEDNGPGITKENLNKIFNRYERINASANLGGLGLGLYISKQVVEAHGGELLVESIFGKGTKFSVLLPIFFNIMCEDTGLLKGVE